MKTSTSSKRVQRGIALFAMFCLMMTMIPSVAFAYEDSAPVESSIAEQEKTPENSGTEKNEMPSETSDADTSAAKPSEDEGAAGGSDVAASVDADVAESIALDTVAKAPVKAARRAAMAKAPEAGRDISGKAVTNLTVDRSYLEYGAGNHMIMRVEFAEMGAGGADDLNIRAGDYIKLNWTTKSDMEAGKAENSWIQGMESSSKDLEVVDEATGQKVVVGRVEVTNDGATITFNENVNKLYNVKGFAEVKAYTNNEENGEDHSKSTITAGEKEVEVTINGYTYKYEGIGSKSGWQAGDTEVNEWTFKINPGCQRINTDYVIDEYIPEGQELLEIDQLNKIWNGSVPYFREYKMAETAGKKAVVKREFAGTKYRTYETMAAAGGAKWEKISDRHYRLTLPQEMVNGRFYTFSLFTKVTDRSSLAKVSDITYTADNNYTLSASYTTPDNKPASTDGEKVETTKSYMKFSNAGITGVSPSAIKITKKTPTGKVLQNISFTLTRKDGGKMNDAGDTSMVVTTDSKGEALVENLYDGEYIFSENVDTTPNWIQLPVVNGTETGVTVDATVDRAAAEGESVVAVNMPKIVEDIGVPLSVTKVWKKYDGSEDTEDHPTVYFQLYRQVEGGSPEKAKYLVVDERDTVTAQILKGHEEDIPVYEMPSSETTHEFKSEKDKKIPAYNDSGKKYTYTVKEVDAEGNDFTPEEFTKEEDGMTVTNTRKQTFGDLRVSKAVKGNAADMDKSFEFTIKLDDASINETLSGVEFKDGVGKISLKNGESKTIEGIPSGTTYTVEEKDYSGEGYVVEMDGEKGTIVKDQTSEASFINTKDTFGDLTVSKAVAGNDVDRSKAFHFTVTLDDPSICGIYGDMEFSDGVAEFTLKDGEEKTAEGLPNGVKYTVEEDDYSADGYEAELTGAEGTIEGDKTATADCINTRNTFGDLTVSKIVKGSAGDKNKAFHFTILTDSDIEGTYGDMEFVGGMAKFTLKHGETKTAIGLPNGIEYDVSEVEYGMNGYTTTIRGDHGDFIENGKTKSVTFINMKNKKVVKPEPKEPGKPGKKSPKRGHDVPNTGDNPFMGLWMTSALLAAVVLFLLGAKRRHTDN